MNSNLQSCKTWGFLPNLKCIFKSHNPVKYYSLKKSFHKCDLKLNPLWVTGFTDAEGCFSIIVVINSMLNIKIRFSFEINLHSKDIDILYKIKNYFSEIGSIYLRKNKELAVYRVSSVDELCDIIIPHFDKYPLITRKYIDFYFWCKALNLIRNKEHKTSIGLMKVLKYYATINRGASNNIKILYPDIQSFNKESLDTFYCLPEKLNPYWVTGFVAGDGGFSLNLYIKEKNDKIKYRTSYKFYVTQHIKDVEVMKLFIDFFNCGTVYQRSNSNTPRCDFIVQNINDLLEHIIPHFESYPLFNIKQKDFLPFKEGLLFIKQEKLLTKSGLQTLKKICIKFLSKSG